MRPSPSSRIRFAWRPMASSTRGGGAELAHLVAPLQGEHGDALHLRLGDVHNFCAGQVLAQQHAEHGRLGRVLPQHPRQLQPRLIRTGVE